MWSECTKKCEGGVKTSERKIIQDPMYGGRQCEGNHTRRLPCNLKPCPGTLNANFRINQDLTLTLSNAKINRLLTCLIRFLFP